MDNLTTPNAFIQPSTHSTIHSSNKRSHSGSPFWDKLREQSARRQLTCINVSPKGFKVSICLFINFSLGQVLNPTSYSYQEQITDKVYFV